MIEIEVSPAEISDLKEGKKVSRTYPTSYLSTGIVYVLSDKQSSVFCRLSDFCESQSGEEKAKFSRIETVREVAEVH